jgi:hypothetical protein
MTEFTRDRVRAIVADIESTLRALETKHGVRIRRGNARFTADTITLKVEVARVNQDTGEALSKEMVALKMRYPLLVGKTYISPHSGKKIQFVGYNGRARKYPLIYKEVHSTKRFRTSSAIVYALQEA